MKNNTIHTYILM